MAGDSVFFKENNNSYPKVFREIFARPMIQHVVDNLLLIEGEKRFVFIINEIDAKKYKLDNVLRMLTNDNCDIVLQHALTKGSVCSLLLGVKYINYDNPIIISNSDQIIDHDLNKIISFFRQPGVDGGVVCFDSVHPQWSYVKVIGDNKLVETAEKEPISCNAIAGFYYFARGRDFVESSMTSIIKNRSHGGLYYTSLVMNEMILQNKNLKMYQIKTSEYHSFYSPEKILAFEQQFKGFAP